MTDYASMKLWERELVFTAEHKDHPQGQYAILWEDPSEPEAAAAVTRPSPVWLAMAMHGGILPPVEVYHALKDDSEAPGFTKHTRGHLLHETPPLPEMTEEEAMEYLVMKDIPRRVWKDYKGNRCIMKIVPVELIPSDRSFREAWTINQNEMEVAA